MCKIQMAIPKEQMKITSKKKKKGCFFIAIEEIS